MSTSLDWSKQQLEALDRIQEWFRTPGSPQTFYLAGYAGTGKTTLIAEVARMVGGNVVYAAFTGKAASVMRKKGCAGAKTIDGLIYRPRIEYSCTRKPPCHDPEEGCGGEGELCRYLRQRHVGHELNPASAAAFASLIIIDEVSMVDYEMARDLKSFGVKILVIGDPAQLPPIKSKGYFTSGEPDYLLTEIHRQMAGSPIIKMAERIRNEGWLPLGEYGTSSVVDPADVSVEDLLAHDQVIVGTHRTRVIRTNQMREALGYDGVLPHIGEKVICLKNNHGKDLQNGTTWTVTGIDKPDRGFVDIRIKDDDVETFATVPVEAFTIEDGTGGELPGDPFMFAQCITCHKAQGSQYGSVLVVDESNIWGKDRYKWMYTALTRAAERVMVERPSSTANRRRREMARLAGVAS